MEVESFEGLWSGNPDAQETFYLPSFLRPQQVILSGAT